MQTFVVMYIREVKNRSGSVSIQIIRKHKGRYKVVKTVGCGAVRHEIDHLKQVAYQEIERMEAQPSLFVFENDEWVDDTIYKELERVLKEEKSSISLQKASEITHNMYQITYQLPESKQIKSALLNMDAQQRELYEIVQKKF